MACENCTLNAACEVLQRDKPADTGEVMRVLGALTPRDSQRLDYAIQAAGKNSSIRVDGQECMEPRRAFMGIGRTACDGRLVIEQAEIVEG